MEGRGGGGHGRRGGYGGRGRGYDRGFSGGGGGRGGGRSNPEQGWKTQEDGYRAMEQVLDGVKTVSTRPVSMASTIVKDVPVGAIPLARRPDDKGRIGKRMGVCANHFLLKSSVTRVYQYDIEITAAPYVPPGLLDEKDEAKLMSRKQEDLPMGLCRDIISKCAELNGWPLNTWIFDGKRNLFSPEEFLGEGKHSLEVGLPGRRRDRVFQVTIQWAATPNLTDLYEYIKHSNIPLPQSSIQVLEVALRFGAEMMPNCVTSGRSLFFDDSNTKRRLPGGAELWLGYHQSVKPCQLGLTLNIDTTAGAFLQARGLVEVLVEAAGLRDVRDFQRGISDQQFRKMRKAVSGLMISTTHMGENNQKKKIKSITQDAAKNLYFEGRGGERLSVAEYWQKTYGPLELDYLPCMDVSRGQKLIYLPPEVCMVAPGQCHKKLTDAQAREVITFTAKKPHDRKQEIHHTLNTAGLSSDGVVRKFGINIENRMVELEGRILPQPHLEYTRPGTLDTGNRGQWNLGGIQFLRGGSIKGWGLVNFERQDRVSGPGESGLKGFISGLMSTLKDLGLGVPDQPPTLVHGDPRQSPVVAMETCLNKAASQFGEVSILLVLLPTTDSGLYNAVKSAGNMILGIATQCFVASKAGIGGQPRGRAQYLANLAMKINHKVGGVNTQLAGPVQRVFPVVGDRPFIVLGADVTHPLGFNQNEPSVAAIVGSMDECLGQYVTRVIVQKHRQELIDACTPVKEILMTFYQRTNGLKPESILFYRDGISDGQFQKCLQHEYTEIRKACRELEEGYTPPITFVIVQKRHHTRLFPQNPREGDRNGNVQPGTVVDSGIVGPKDFEFFLNSQAGIQGTNKPARYHVLVDENGFGSDALQLMTYWMCYLYCRCTRSVSYVPAAFYAHLAATHGKLLLNDSSSEVDAPVNQENNINNRIQNAMFFV